MAHKARVARQLRHVVIEPPSRIDRPLDATDFDGCALDVSEPQAATESGSVVTPIIFKPSPSGLLEHILDRERERLELVASMHALVSDHARANSGDQAAGGSQLWGLPSERHDWPLQMNPARDVAAFDLYDHRPDDLIFPEIERGRRFIERFGLLSLEPDFAGACAALNSTDLVMTLSALPTDPLPDVSIIIPVWGQLAYTLNALDSLFGHRSKYRVEIIVIDDRSPDLSPEILPMVSRIRYHHQPVNGGFIASCNTGGALARGRYLLMLNNDVRVAPGFLDALVDSFVDFPHAGLVGAKLFNDDGSLQEAGGIFWRDGSSWNFGRNDDPGWPAYCHARKVDYVSGCAIMVPALLWRKLGGFDPAFAPAYGEDADLAFRVRAEGRETWLQPTARVIHYEGKTSGRDLAKGVKAYQLVNERKLVRRWHRDLRSHRVNGKEPLLERERDVRARALVVDAVMPTPMQDAGSVTTMQTLQLYGELGYKTYFVPQDNFLFDPTNTPLLHRVGIETAYAPYYISFERWLSQHGPSLDVVQVYRVSVLECVLDLLRKYAPQAPILFHNMDLHYLRLERQAELYNDEPLRIDAAKMKNRELDMISRVDCTITHSAVERDLVLRDLPEAPVVVWPFMFPIQGTKVGFVSRSGYAFLGGYLHGPNVDAVEHFVADILPLIRLRQPDATFYIVGANPSPRVLTLVAQGVVVTGMIADLRTIFDRVRVFVCPLRIGAGVKGKISVAMSYGLPVVTTPIGAEGIELIDGQDMLLADGPEAFAEMSIKAHEDETLWSKLSLSSLRTVETNHSLALGRRVLESAIEKAMDKRYGAVPTPNPDAANCAASKLAEMPPSSSAPDMTRPKPPSKHAGKRRAEPRRTAQRSE